MGAPKGNGRNSRKVAPAKIHTDNANDSKAKVARFTGTDNPRHLRVIHVLLVRPVAREQLDTVAGASNSPELVAELRRRGLDVPCERIRFVDRDGCICRPGVYAFTTKDRRLIWAWKARMKKGSNGKRS